MAEPEQRGGAADQNQDNAPQARGSGNNLFYFRYFVLQQKKPNGKTLP